MIKDGVLKLPNFDSYFEKEKDNSKVIREQIFFKKRKLDDLNSITQYSINLKLPFENIWFGQSSIFIELPGELFNDNQP